MVKVEQLVSLFTDVLKKHTDYFPKEWWHTSIGSRTRIIAPNVIFVNGSLETLEELIDYLADEKRIESNFTREDVQRIVEDKVKQGIELSGGKEAPKKLVLKLATELLNELNCPPTRWLVIAPFNNIVLKSDPYSVGNVHFYKYREENFENVICSSGIREKLWSVFGDKMVGEVEVSASSRDKAEELAQVEYDLAISLLRIVYPQATISFETFHLMREGSKPFLPSFSRNLQWRFDFGEGNLEEQVNKLLEIMNPVVSGDKGNDLIRRCLQALRWYGMAVRDDFAPDKFVKFVTALEVLVLTGGKRGLTKEFGENLSILLVHPRKTKEEMKKEMKDIYGIRCDIVHRADYSNLKEEHTTRVQDQCRRIILALAENVSKFKSFDEFLKHAIELRSNNSSS